MTLDDKQLGAKLAELRREVYFEPQRARTDSSIIRDSFSGFRTV